MSETYRQVLIEKYPDRRKEIEAIDFPGLDMLKPDDCYSKEKPFPGPNWLRTDDFMFMILSCCRYYQVKLDECEKMYQDDVIQY